MNPGRWRPRPARGGQAIGPKSAKLVQASTSRWGIDQILRDPDRGRTVPEWTAHQTGTVPRGGEWHESDPATGLPTIRAYLASPPAPGADHLELERFCTPNGATR